MVNPVLRRIELLDAPVRSSFRELNELDGILLPALTNEETDDHPNRSGRDAFLSSQTGQCSTSLSKKLSKQ